jgi:hypothetical protein
LHDTERDEDERRDDRVEMIAVAISFLLMISGLAAIVAARHVDEIRVTLPFDNFSNSEQGSDIHRIGLRSDSEWTHRAFAPRFKTGLRFLTIGML